MTLKSNRAFAKPPSKIAQLLGNKFQVAREEQIFVAYPPTKGPQACVIKIVGRNGVQRLMDAVVVIPSKVPYLARRRVPLMAAALAISATIHRNRVKELLQDKVFMSEVPDSIEQIPFRTPLDTHIAQVIRTSHLAMESVLARHGKTARELLRSKEELEFVLLDLQRQKWSPWIVEKDRAKDAKHLHEALRLIQEWPTMECLNWAQRWCNLYPDQAKRLKKANRVETIELQGKNLGARCRRWGLWLRNG